MTRKIVVAVWMLALVVSACSKRKLASVPPRVIDVDAHAAPPRPTLTLVAAPAAIETGQSATLSWSSAGATSVAIAGIGRPSYGSEFLRVMSSVYPGLHGSRSLGDLVVGTCYGLLDGALCGLVVGWLYNRVVRVAVTA